MIGQVDKPITGEDPASLRMLAQQCRRLARGASTREVSASLNEIASRYEMLAARGEAGRTATAPGTTSG